MPSTIEEAPRAFVVAPFESETYRNLAYLVLACPLGLAYFVLLVVGASLTLSLSITLLGPIALGGTLLLAVGVAWVDGKLTAGVLGVDVEPAFPDRDGGLIAFAKRLVFGRETCLGLAYLAWRALFGLVAFLLLVIGFSLAASLLVAPLAYGPFVVFHVPGWTYALDTPARAFGAFVLGAVLALATINAANLLARIGGDVAVALLDTGAIED